MPGQPLTLWLRGKPSPKARARVTKSGRAYTPKATVNAETAWRITAQTEMEAAGIKRFEGPVVVELRAVFEPPASWSKKKRAAALLGEILPTGRPDLDNLTKLATDGLNGIAYADDSQIVTTIASKKYGIEALTVVTVRSAEYCPHANSRASYDAAVRALREIAVRKGEAEPHDETERRWAAEGPVPVEKLETAR